MRRRRRRLFLLLPFSIACAGLLAWLPRLIPAQALFLHEDYPQSLEQAAREHFLREHRGERPLNEDVAAAAVASHRSRPMGKFVLGIKAGDEGNDCSDFVNCALDEGMGAKARFKRHSSRHLVARNPDYFDIFAWDRKQPLLPGDSIAVEHSPWYKPYAGACWHVGIIGTDGQVYDFIKLKSWPSARYGRTPVSWFTHNAPSPGQVVIGRLRPQFRYRLEEIPVPQEAPGSAPLRLPTRGNTGEPER